MSPRLRIGPSPDGPLVVTGSGFDPDNPTFQDVLFNADHATLRVLQKGQATLFGPGILSPGQVGTFTAVSSPLAKTFSGARPLITCIGRSRFTINPFPAQWTGPFMATFTGSGDAFTNPSRGSGFGVCSTASHVYALCWHAAESTLSGSVLIVRPGQAQVRYMVFENAVGG